MGLRRIPASAGWAAFAVALLTGSAAWLWLDGPLDAEAAAWIADIPPVEATPDNGYLLLVGLGAPPDDDAGAFGAALVSLMQAGEALGAGNPSLREYPLPRSSLLCSPSASGCAEPLLQRTESPAVLIEEHSDMLDRYRRLLQATRFRTLAPAHMEVQPLAPEYLSLGAQLLRIQVAEYLASGRTDEALALLAKDIAGLRRHLALADEFLYKMALERLFREQLIFLEILLERGLIGHGQWPKPDLLSPLAVSERDLTAPLQRETAAMAQVLQAIARDPSMHSESGVITSASLPSVYKPNQCVRSLYKPIRHMAELSRLGPEEFGARDSLPPRETTWRRLRNPVCTVLIDVALPDFTRQMQRFHALDDQLEALREALT